MYRAQLLHSKDIIVVEFKKAFFTIWMLYSKELIYKSSNDLLKSNLFDGKALIISYKL